MWVTPLSRGRYHQPARGALNDLQVPSEIVSQIVAHMRDDQRRARVKVSNERALLESQLTAIRNQMDKAYSDKLDGKIAEDFWQRLMTEWRMEEQQVKMAIQGLYCIETGDRALDAQKIFELANSAYSLYVSQNSVEKAKLLRLVFSNFSVEAVSVCPTYRRPFDVIAKRAEGFTSKYKVLIIIEIIFPHQKVPSQVPYENRP